MPQVPIIIPRVSPAVPEAPIGNAWEAASRMYDAVDNLFAGAAKVEAARSVAEGVAESEGITQLNADKHDNPAVFLAQNVTELENAYKARIDAATTPRARELIRAGLSDNLIKAKYKSQHIFNLKTRDKMEADFVVATDLLKQSAVGGTDEEQAAAASDFGRLLAGQVAIGAKTKEQAAQLKIKFRDDVRADTMNLKAASQPVSFFEEYNAGTYKNNNAVDVQRALDIAERSQRARDEKVKKDTAWASREAERMAIGQAEKGQLNVEELDRTAEFYQWPEEKTDKIKQIQLGLRETNPNAQALIADALAPIIKPDPSMADINTAGKKMIALADKVDPKSREYRAGMDKIRALLRSTRISNEIQTNQAERKVKEARVTAKRQITELMNKNDPRLNAVRRRQQLGDAYDQIEGMTPAEARSFVESKRKEYETKKTNKSNSDKAIDDLMGLIK